ncbi:hypothetical protein QQY24_30025 [Streptomyces sp. TG1A-8]|uniref:hypothetical protein n=1 Tax=Streptomyces sp. TG1A-8 TaxID=3051385 RepID=UPI00265BD624|nr:hypothetical protein [Streptomyces sp. TG1A-8]MDO0929442.1 hypothetical protein [Streptomyces sp. TG1A-8]
MPLSGGQAAQFGAGGGRLRDTAGQVVAGDGRCRRLDAPQRERAGPHGEPGDDAREGEHQGIDHQRPHAQVPDGGTDGGQRNGHDDAAAGGGVRIRSPDGVQRDGDHAPLVAVAPVRDLEGGAVAGRDRGGVQDREPWGAAPDRPQRVLDAARGIDVGDVDIAGRLALHRVARVRCGPARRVRRVRQPRGRRGSGAQAVVHLLHQLPLQQSDEQGVAGRQGGAGRADDRGPGPPELLRTAVAG